ncbi:MAG TPA: ribonuclease H family protein [Saprospiraceae bacterium]|nr:ribonuclease H family protein [Saprospiraceae bacterium]
MAIKQKYYVVWKGIQPGIYEKWDEAKAQITGFQGAQYKSFETQSEAIIAYREGHKFVNNKKSSRAKVPGSNSGILKPSISVDAACSGNPGDMEYRGVNNQNGAELFKRGPYKDGTNNIGEFLAIVHALSILKKNGHDTLPIYSDSETAMTWVRKKKANTKLELTSRNHELFELIKRAESWLIKNTYKNPILKWETTKWGENPADFGRK